MKGERNKNTDAAAPQETVAGGVSVLGTKRSAPGEENRVIVLDSQTFVFRRCTPSHAEELAAVDQECNRPPWTADQFVTDMQARTASVFGLFDESQCLKRATPPLVGFASVQTVLDESHIHNFGISPHFRRRGVGTAFLRELLLLLEKSGTRTTTLDVRASNILAQRLYEKCGFKIVGNRPRLYPDDGENGLILRRAHH